MNALLSLPAPGKLNLFLRIVGRREDGYHLLQTLFQLVEFGDELSFEELATGAIEVEPGIQGVAPDRNLIHRAARMLQERTGCRSGARIHLVKRLPMGGGMGGGSSDAATTLVGLNHLWGTGLTREQLAELALRLGADVPVFVHGKSAWAEGIGERLTPVEVAPAWYVVVTPAVHIATADVFASPQLTRNSPPITIADFLKGSLENACESVVRGLFPEVDRLIRWLSQWGPARMTGTGSSVFLPCENRAAADEIRTRIPGQWRGIVTRGINDSPLYGALELT